MHNVPNYKLHTPFQSSKRFKFDLHKQFKGWLCSLKSLEKFWTKFASTLTSTYGFIKNFYIWMKDIANLSSSNKSLENTSKANFRVL